MTFYPSSLNVWGFNCSFMFRTCRCLQKGATGLDKSFVKGSRKSTAFLENFWIQSGITGRLHSFNPLVASVSCCFWWPTKSSIQIFFEKMPLSGLASCGLLDPYRTLHVESWWFQRWLERHWWWQRDLGGKTTFLCLERCPWNGKSFGKSLVPSMPGYFSLKLQQATTVTRCIFCETTKKRGRGATSRCT